MKRIVAHLFDLGKSEYIRMELSVVNNLTDLYLIPTLGILQGSDAGQLQCIIEERSVPHKAPFFDVANSFRVDGRK